MIQKTSSAPINIVYIVGYGCAPGIQNTRVFSNLKKKKKVNSFFSPVSIQRLLRLNMYLKIPRERSPNLELENSVKYWFLSLDL